MYAVVRRYKMDSLDRLVARVTGEFADRIPAAVGSLLYTAINTGDGTAMTVVLFPDEETARRSEALVGQVEQSLGSQADLEIGEVSRGEVMVSRATEGVLAPVDFHTDGG